MPHSPTQCKRSCCSPLRVHSSMTAHYSNNVNYIMTFQTTKCLKVLKSLKNLSSCTISHKNQLSMIHHKMIVQSTKASEKQPTKNNNIHFEYATAPAAILHNAGLPMSFKYFLIFFLGKVNKFKSKQFHRIINKPFTSIIVVLIKMTKKTMLIIHQ